MGLSRKHNQGNDMQISSTRELLAWKQPGSVYFPLSKAKRRYRHRIAKLNINMHNTNRNGGYFLQTNMLQLSKHGCHHSSAHLNLANFWGGAVLPPFAKVAKQCGIADAIVGRICCII